jgi:hypothetical protein
MVIRLSISDDFNARDMCMQVDETQIKVRVGTLIEV